MIIQGANSDGDVFVLRIDWHPISKLLAANFVLRKDGVEYKFDAVDTVERNAEAYKIKGLSLEVISPLRLYRIVYRGIVTRKNLSDGATNDTFIRLRFFW